MKSLKAYLAGLDNERIDYAVFALAGCNWLICIFEIFNYNIVI